MVVPVVLSVGQTDQKAGQGVLAVGRLAHIGRACLFDAQVAGHKSMRKKEIAKMRKKNSVRSVG